MRILILLFGLRRLIRFDFIGLNSSFDVFVFGIPLSESDKDQAGINNLPRTSVNNRSL